MNKESHSRNWPLQTAVVSCRGATFKVDDGAVRFCGVAVCDDRGEPTLKFSPGQKAFFYFEYEILRKLDTPIGGLSFRDASGLVIHGNTTIQHASPSPDSVPCGSRLRFSVELQLNISPGDYWFSLGLSSTTAQVFENYCFADLGYRDLESQFSIHSSINDFGPFTVTADPRGKLLHHGLVNLPGGSVVAVDTGRDQVSHVIYEQRLQHDLHIRPGAAIAAITDADSPGGLVPRQVFLDPGNESPKGELQSIKENTKTIGLIQLASYPRSGNTWLRNLVEFYFDRKVSSLYAEGQDNLVYVSGEEGDLFVPYLNGFAPIRPHKKLMNGIGEIFNIDMRELLTKLDEQFVVKTHEFPCEPFIQKEAVVYIVRHPAAAIWSYYRFLKNQNTEGFGDLTLEDVICGRVAFGSWSEHVNAWLKAGETLGSRFQLIKYDQLGTNENDVCQGFSKLTGLPRRGFIGTFPAFKYWQQQQPEFFRKGGEHDWRDCLTRDQIELIIKVHGETARRVGYQIDCD